MNEFTPPGGLQKASWDTVDADGKFAKAKPPISAAPSPPKPLNRAVKDAIDLMAPQDVARAMLMAQRRLNLTIPVPKVGFR